MYINISYDEGIQEDSNIEAVIRKVCDEVSRVYGLEEDEMSILLCDNAKIHKLNKEYRGIDRPTDVLGIPSGIRLRRICAKATSVCWSA